MGTTTKVVDRTYLTKQFKNFNDTLVKPGLEDLDDRKVDKVAGKGLSKNDFTDALKTKLEGLENVELETEPIDFYTLDSDEFTYTKTPGTISKLFVHLFRNPENLSGEDTALRNNDDYIVDADGVVRYEFGRSNYGNSLYKINDNNDIVAVFDTNLTENSYLYNIYDSLRNSNGDNNDAYDKLLDDISKDESGVFNGINANSETITLSTRTELQRLINNALTSYSSSPNNHDYYNSEDDNDKISISPRANNAFILSSDKLFAKYNMSSGGSPDGIPVAYYSFDEASYQISYVLQKWNNSDYRQNESYGFHGLSIIEKALETGRALDIGIDITNLPEHQWWWVN